MIKIIKRNICNVDYTHFLAFHDGACNRLHGHTSWNVGVEVTGEQDKNGMIIDYGILKSTVKEVVMPLDHKFIINKKYIVGDKLPERYLPFRMKKMSIEELQKFCENKQLYVLFQENFMEMHPDEETLSEKYLQEKMSEVINIVSEKYKQIHIKYHDTEIISYKSNLYFTDYEPTLENICSALIKPIADKLWNRRISSIGLIMSEGMNNECVAYDVQTDKHWTRKWKIAKLYS